MEFFQGRIRAAGHLGQGAFFGAGSQAGRGAARGRFGGERAAQALALLEFSHKTHADPEVGRYLSLRVVRQGSHRGHSFA